MVVDDCSTDGTRERLHELAARPDDKFRVLFHDHNRGKGAALRTGFAQVRGDIVIVQDADLEYDPTEYPKLIASILAGRLTSSTAHVSLGANLTALCISGTTSATSSLLCRTH